MGRTTRFTSRITHAFHSSFHGFTFSLGFSGSRFAAVWSRSPASCVCSVWSAGRCTRADCLRVVRGVEWLRPLTGLVVCLPARAARRRGQPAWGGRRPHVRSHRAQTVWRDTARRGAAGSRRRRGDHCPPHAAQAPRRHVHDTTHHSRGTPETRPPNPQHGCPGNPLSALAPHLHHTQRAYLSRQVHQSRYGRRASTHAPLSLLRVSLLTHGRDFASRRSGR